MKKTALLIITSFFMTNLTVFSQYVDYIGAGHYNGITVTHSGTGLLGEGANTVNASGMDQHLKDASRFLGQATAGVNFEYIESVSEQDFGDGIDAQILMPKMNPYVR
jgi:hypothetical protein